jgi:hypothetical protein
MAEALGRETAGETFRYAMCDTDSMAFVRPKTMSRETFDAAIARVTGWFERLSPYANDKNLFARDMHEPDEAELRFFGVSCKRYALYQREDDGSIKLRKVSAHGTGHLSFDRASDDAAEPDDANEPDYANEPDDYATEPGEATEPDNAKPTAKWQERIWRDAIARAETGIWKRTPQRQETKLTASFPIEKWSVDISRMREAVTTPAKLLQYEALGVRPFSFFMTLPEIGRVRCATWFAESASQIRANGLWNARTGEPISRDQMKFFCTPMHVTLGDYFQHAESKAVPINADDTPARFAGWLTRHILIFNGKDFRTRTGQKQRQDDLFARDVEAELESI